MVGMSLTWLWEERSIAKRDLVESCLVGITIWLEMVGVGLDVSKVKSVSVMMNWGEKGEFYKIEAEEAWPRGLGSDTIWMV